jgi:hypothetical protein
VDYNGNHQLDPNEPGVPKVKVALDQAGSAVLTDKNGYYLLSAPANHSEVRVDLDMSTVPAVYNVSHGTQLAKVYKDSLTEVNLCLVPLISLAGRVMAVDPNGARILPFGPNLPEFMPLILDLMDPNDIRKPLSGVRVCLSNTQSGLLFADSVTGTDGTYYLGNIQPGRYVLRIEQNTLAKQYELAEPHRIIEVKSAREELLEIQEPDFVATISRKPTPSDNPPANGADKENPKTTSEQKPWPRLRRSAVNPSLWAPDSGKDGHSLPVWHASPVPQVNLNPYNAVFYKHTEIRHAFCTDEICRIIWRNIPGRNEVAP